MILTITKILQRLLPNYCLICLDPSRSSLALCRACIQQLPWHTDPCCSRCALPLPSTTLCGECLREPPAFTQVVSPFHYQPPIDRFIHQLKFNQKLIYAHIIGNLLAEHIQQRSDPLPQAILPVPLHTERLRQRGYNQATEICKPLTRRLKLPCDQRYLARTKNTAPQAQLKAHERRVNVKNAFTIQAAIPYSHIAVVDDVMTTGATLRQLCQLIQRNGVQRIEIWCVARA